MLPLFFFASYSITLMHPSKSWFVLTLGLMMVGACAIVVILLITYWEEAIRRKLHGDVHQTELKLFLPKETKVTSLDTSLIQEANKSEILHELDSTQLFYLQNSLKESQYQHSSLIEEIQLKNEKLQRVDEEKKLLMDQCEQVAHDFADYKIFSEEQLKQKSIQIHSLQQNIEDKNVEIEKHKEQISQLDIKIQDLSYEIKTLLYLHESESKIVPQVEKNNKVHSISNAEFSAEDYSHQVGTQVLENKIDILQLSDTSPNMVEEASSLLKRCIEVTQKLAGSNYYGNESSRYWELSTPHYAIDQRRLFDSLKSEENGLIVFVYYPRENKALFVNNQVKDVLGWSPDKFITDFSNIIHEGASDWKKGLNSLVSEPESQIRLLVKAKDRQEIMMHCHLGALPSGLFRNYVIGVLYPMLSR